MGMAVTAYLMILKWNEDYGVKTSTQQPPVELTADNIALPQTQSTKEQNQEIPVQPRQKAGGTSEQPKSSEQSVNRDMLVVVKTDVLDIVIDRHGGDIVRAALPAYPLKINTPNIPFLLIDPRNHYAAQSGLIGKDGTDTASGRPLFKVARQSYRLENGKNRLIVDLHDTTAQGVVITKRFTFERGKYLIGISYIIDNKSKSPFTAAMFGQIKRDSQRPVVSDVKGMRLRPFTGGATFKADSPYTKLKFDNIAEQPYEDTVKGGYMAMVQHYFVSAWVPKANEMHTYTARKLPGEDIYLFGFTTPSWTVAPGATYTEKASFYVGPKKQYRLKAISPGLNLTVDYGFLWWLAEPLFALLTFIHSVVGNWGVSIILLTMVVKALLYPLSATSLRSMAKMRRLQPEMARLKERYGDDRQQFSQAMMELYKKEGTNPLGGCLPMVMQMPVFLALYWTLMESVELRHSPFIFWIHDLSAMDPYFVLPILMGGSMFLNQMMQPEPPDPVQAKVFKFMPVMFTFFFLFFPSGLVLYWLVNNLLSVLQQWYVTRQLEKSKSS